MAGIGMIIVSHSERLAEGVVELAGEMCSGRTPIVAAGGTGDGRIGTNTLRIQKAIESLEDCDHILIYCDMGSSIISSRTAMELVEEDDEDLAAKVHLVDCPLVEGAFAGAVQASVGDTVEAVIRTSEKARHLHKV
jgi:PTS hybrid protein